MHQSTLFREATENLFRQTANAMSFDEKVSAAVNNLKQLLLDGHVFVVAVSFGKL